MTKTWAWCELNAGTLHGAGEGLPDGADDDGGVTIVVLPSTRGIVVAVSGGGSTRWRGTRVQVPVVVENRVVRGGTSLQSKCLSCKGVCPHEPDVDEWLRNFHAQDLEFMAGRAKPEAPGGESFSFPLAAPLHKDSCQQAGFPLRMSDDPGMLKRVERRAGERSDFQELIPYFEPGATCGHLGCTASLKDASVKRTGKVITYIGQSFVRLGVHLCVLVCTTCRFEHVYKDKEDATVYTKGYVTTLEYLYDLLRMAQHHQIRFSAQAALLIERFRHQCRGDEFLAANPDVSCLILSFAPYPADTQLNSTLPLLSSSPLPSAQIPFKQPFYQNILPLSQWPAHPLGRDMGMCGLSALLRGGPPTRRRYL